MTMRVDEVCLTLPADDIVMYVDVLGDLMTELLEGGAEMEPARVVRYVSTLHSLRERLNEERWRVES